MPNGYTGRILHVDLTSGSLTVEEPQEAFYRKYLGGSAMGMHYILRDMPKGADPLGPENVLTLFTGVTTGAAISGQSRLNANAKSPISGGIARRRTRGRDRVRPLHRQRHAALHARACGRAAPRRAGRGAAPGARLRGRVRGARLADIPPSLDRVYDNAKARRELGWRPRHDFESVVARLAAGGDLRSELAQAVGAKGYHRTP